MAKYVKVVECAEIISEELNISLYDLVYIFGKVPAADVVEVVHGEWINEDFPEKVATQNDFAICSVCKKSSHKAEHGYSILSAYCPNCGAKMGGERKEK